MKLGQLIEYSMRNVFIEGPFEKFGGEAGLRLFCKKSKLSMCLHQQPEMFKSLFLLYVQVEVYQNNIKLRCQLLAFTLHKAFFKKKKSSGINLLTSFYV